VIDGRGCGENCLESKEDDMALFQLSFMRASETRETSIFKVPFKQIQTCPNMSKPGTNSRAWESVLEQSTTRCSSAFDHSDPAAVWPWRSGRRAVALVVGCGDADIAEGSPEISSRYIVLLGLVYSTDAQEQSLAASHILSLSDFCLDRVPTQEYCDSAALLPLERWPRSMSQRAVCFVALRC
jgi:hypothetical protein